MFTLLFLSQSAVADYAISAAEIMQMPPFCRGLSIANFQDDAKPLKQDIKAPGEHTQHFCHGIKAILRKEYHTATTEFDYVQSHSTSQHVLLPATSLFKAEALGMQNKISEALEEYNKAIQLKPNYASAYLKFANYYIKLNQKNDAIKTIKLGLNYSPKSKSLQRKLQTLEKK